MKNTKVMHQHTHLFKVLLRENDFILNTSGIVLHDIHSPCNCPTPQAYAELRRNLQDMLPQGQHPVLGTVEFVSSGNHQGCSNIR